MFEGEPPSGASTTIRSYIARLRRAFTSEQWARPEVLRLQSHPLNEKIRGQHMLALYRAGRQVVLDRARSLAGSSRYGMALEDKRRRRTRDERRKPLEA